MEGSLAPPGALGQSPHTRSEEPEKRGPLRRFTSYLAAHPILALLLLSPGIPEYLSSSSSVTALLTAPPVFLLFLAFNLGMYGPGVLLIREAKIRWGKGWATVILLGAAYAILEEGIALSTFFNSHASVVGALGSYGHFAGVSWVWVAGLLMVHIVFSISLPILLLDLALPKTRGRPLLTARGIRYVVGILAIDILLLFLLVLKGEGFWMGWPVLTGSLLAIAALVLAARIAPPSLLLPSRGPPTARPWVFALLGLGLFPGTLVIEGVGGARGAAPVTVIAALGLFYAFLFWIAARWLGDRGHEAQLVAFAAGVVGFIAFFGFLASLPVPLVTVVDAAFGYLFLQLWRRYAVPTGPPVPRQAAASG
ncbi:MAG: hypothetical protein L3K19_02450 [Thermoplasmata archaeon]|nr:hypothetical protein [Thermoplasmata archaeon]